MPLTDQLMAVDMELIGVTMLFQAGIWIVGVGLIWFIQRRQKSPSGAIEATKNG
jgi:hypothetical protein